MSISISFCVGRRILIFHDSQGLNMSLIYCGAEGSAECCFQFVGQEFVLNEEVKPNFFLSYQTLGGSLFQAKLSSCKYISLIPVEA